MLLSPNDKPSRVVAKYPVLEVLVNAGQLASLARLPASIGLTC